MKLLISDLDGTLYPRRESLNPHQQEENFKAVKRWVDRGYQFAVATARGLYHYPAIREALGFDVHFIGGNEGEPAVYRRERDIADGSKGS